MNEKSLEKFLNEFKEEFLMESLSEAQEYFSKVILGTTRGRSWKEIREKSLKEHWKETIMKGTPIRCWELVDFLAAFQKRKC